MSSRGAGAAALSAGMSIDDRCVPFGVNDCTRALYVSATYRVPLPAYATDIGKWNWPSAGPGGQPNGWQRSPIVSIRELFVALKRRMRLSAELATASVPPSGERATPYGVDHTGYVFTWPPVVSLKACTLRLRRSAT